MAKQRGATRLTGKMGDNIYSETRYGFSVKQAPKSTNKKKIQPALVEQNSRTAVINGLSGVVNRVANFASGGNFKETIFYERMLKLFRKEPTDNRILLLDLLKDIEVHSNYTFREICPKPVIRIKPTDHSFCAELDLLQPANASKNFNSYYLEVILFVWEGNEWNCRYEGQKTEWLHKNDQLPRYYDFAFERRERDEDYVVACRCVTGVNNHSVEMHTDQGMMFLFCGSVTEKGQKLLAEKAASMNNKPPGGKREAKEEKRVVGKMSRD